MRVLIAPLNWGLGHAARCIPIIDNLIHNGIEVIIAADQGPLALLQEYFPSLPFLDFPSLNIEYSTGSNQLVKMMGYVPKLLEQAKKDHLPLAFPVHVTDSVTNMSFAGHRLGSLQKQLGRILRPTSATVISSFVAAAIRRSKARAAE
jgi:hypothetical protein